MIVGVLSGKGGTGKTTLSVNLTDICEGVYVDCDVEEPNGFLFNCPEKIKSQEVSTYYPEINEDLCIGCGQCAKSCMFNALMNICEKVIVFPKLCHDCGACEIVCPNGAITYKKRDIGVIQKGVGDRSIYRGVLNIGEPMAVPVIKSLMKNVLMNENGDRDLVIDCAPGTSCNIVTTIDYIDKAVVVAEPSLFSLEDMKRTIQVLENANIPFGVVVNKAEKNVSIIEDYCKEKELRLLGRLPFSREVAERYSRGEKIVNIDEYREEMKKIWSEVEEM